MCGAARIRPIPDASEIWIPHEIAGGVEADTQKGSVASAAIKAPRLIVETTITDASEFGRMRTDHPAGVAPSARAAWTYRSVSPEAHLNHQP